jgi:hypothetical protein
MIEMTEICGWSTIRGENCVPLLWEELGVEM